MKTKEQDIEIMKLLKLSEISRVICDTNMGTLKLRIRKGENVYRFVLDAVELPLALHNELMELIYPKVIDAKIIPVSQDNVVVKVPKDYFSKTGTGIAKPLKKVNGKTK